MPIHHADDAQPLKLGELPVQSPRQEGHVHRVNVPMIVARVTGLAAKLLQLGHRADQTERGHLGQHRAGGVPLLVVLVHQVEVDQRQRAQLLDRPQDVEVAAGEFLKVREKEDDDQDDWNNKNWNSAKLLQKQFQISYSVVPQCAVVHLQPGERGTTGQKLPILQGKILRHHQRGETSGEPRRGLLANRPPQIAELRGVELQKAQLPNGRRHAQNLFENFRLLIVLQTEVLQLRN